MSEEYGKFNRKAYDSDTGKKVLKVFEKLKQKAELSHREKIRSDPRLNENDDDLYFQRLQRDAVKSLHILPEVLKTEEGFEVQ